MTTSVPDTLGSVGDYTLLERLTPAGPGDLYRARDTRHGRTVTVRILPESVPSDDQAPPFVAEAQRLTRFTHPNVTTVFDAGVHDGRAYLVFEFIKGRPLAAEVHGQPMPARRAVELAIQVADAIAEVHAAGFTQAGISADAVLVTDKGHAKIPISALSSPTGFEAGPGARLRDYRAPEAPAGREADERSDVYSVGSLLYEMLTARPFAPAAPAPSAINPAVPKELDAATLRATAQQPDYRYQSLVTMAAELRSIAAILDVRDAVADEAADEANQRLPVLVLVLLAALVALAWWANR